MKHRSEALARLLSCPGDPEREAELARIQSSNVTDHLAGFLRRRKDEVSARSEGLIPLLETLCERRLRSDEGLAFPAPAIIESLGRNDVDATLVAARIAGHFHGTIKDPSWCATFSSPARVRFGNELTPPVTSLEVDGDPTVSTRAMPVVTVDGQRCFWIAGEDERDSLSLETERPYATCPIDQRVAQFRSAIELTRRYAPEYVDWVASSVRIVACWHGDGDQVISGSFPGHQGVIYCSSPLNALRTAESLIHEAAHQHFQTGEMVTRFHTLDDDRLYWSPYVQKERPIERILLAYHAFANVTAFYLRVLESACDAELRARAQRGLDQHAPNVKLFEGFLEQSNGLTAAGRALYQTIGRRICA